MVDALSFSTATNLDYLYIYNGTSADGPLIDTLTGYMGYYSTGYQWRTNEMFFSFQSHDLSYTGFEFAYTTEKGTLDFTAIATIVTSLVLIVLALTIVVLFAIAFHPLNSIVSDPFMTQRHERSLALDDTFS